MFKGNYNIPQKKSKVKEVIKMLDSYNTMNNIVMHREKVTELCEEIRKVFVAKLPPEKLSYGTIKLVLDYASEVFENCPISEFLDTKN